MNNTALEISGLCKDYPDFSLSNVSFSLPAGYIMGFVGQNGAGKTTTIRLILNMIARDAGSIKVFGLDNIADEQKIKQDIAVVFDDTYFVESWKVAEVEKALKGFYINWNSTLFNQYMKNFHLSVSKRVKELSRGMKMKLMLAVAMSHEAKMLILDEPTSGLDPVARDELLRLGVPTLIYIFILSPITKFGTHMHSVLAGNTTVSSLFSLGVMWYAVMLLVFDLGYLAWRMAVGNRPGRPAAANRPKLSFRAVALFMLALAAASYLLRIAIPYGMWLFGFPSLAYLPQYLGFFLIGFLAYRRDWLRTIPGSLGALGLALALLATVILFPAALIGSGSAFIGHASWQSAVFALWDSIFAIGLSLALITFFRRFVNGEKKFGRFLSRHSFTVYIIHPSVIVFLALAISGIHIQILLKFGLAAVIGIPLCFAVAYLVRKTPFADRVL